MTLALKMEHHVHCISCFNQRCTVKPEPGVSCDLIACPLVCGAVLHSCKVDEHQLLCPLMKVPCLNSGHGCPAMLIRSQMSAHLDVCPAGVVCCTMEWNRWPVSCLNYTSYESLIGLLEEMEQLDMALALQDQQTLLESMKMISKTPSTQDDSVIKKEKAQHVTFQASPPEAPAPQLSSLHQSQLAPKGSAKEKILSGINGLKEEHLSKLYEATVETARSLAAALDFVSSASCGESSSVVQNVDLLLNGNIQNGLEDITPQDADSLHTSNKKEMCSNQSCSGENGALEGTRMQDKSRVNGPLTGATEACADAYLEPATLQMMSPVHVSQGVAQQADHIVQHNKGLVLPGNLGPERMLHLNHFYKGQGQYPLYNGQVGVKPGRSAYRAQAEMEDKAVDTSDLEHEEDPMGLGEIDAIPAALLFCLEESRECRRISDTVYVDGYRVDLGTQTFTFPAAILVTNTRVGDMASASACDHAAPQLNYPSPLRTLRLGQVLEALESEAVPYNRYLPPNPQHQHTFPFLCGQSFRRDQFSSHFRNIHGEIHAWLSGWIEQRCPLAYYGCTFSQRRFYPSTQGAKVVHDRHLKAFGVQPCTRPQPPTDSQSDQFSGLPIEILWHVAGFLDSFSLCQLSLVSRTMREVCASLLQTRGIVELQWERTVSPEGNVSWQVKNKVWRFSTAFTPVSSWGFTEVPSMSVHLKKCPFNVVEQKTEPIPLPAMCTERDGLSLRRVLRHVNT
ncbi:PREDICTED: F-box only protein 30-like [Cyprinodon variegatus]|uniref:F-box protein 30b n=1 Tax=Cyprinodon variegatus TaxID=28743 RepID=A0A3Q2GEL7_CYPVA|nr:PREDICTED: F-box only protein 30-like [Cyprinodon variegatus]